MDSNKAIEVIYPNNNNNKKKRDKIKRGWSDGRKGGRRERETF